MHVTPTASEGDKPVKVLCAQDVYDELSKIKQATPDSFKVPCVMQSSPKCFALCMEKSEK